MHRQGNVRVRVRVVRAAGAGGQLPGNIIAPRRLLPANPHEELGTPPVQARSHGLDPCLRPAPLPLHPPHRKQRAQGRAAGGELPGAQPVRVHHPPSKQRAAGLGQPAGTCVCVCACVARVRVWERVGRARV